MKRIGSIFALAAVCGCTSSASHKAAPFSLDHAGRPSVASGAVALDANWFLAGSAPDDYDATLAVDTAGAAAGSLRSTTPPGGEFGTVMTCVDATALRGQRLALSGSLASSAVELAKLATRVVDHGVPTTGGGLGNGWFLAGSDPGRYQATLGFDGGGAAQGSLASRDSAVSADQFGTIMTSLDASAYAGHPLTLAGSVASSAVSGWAGLWMRIDDAAGNTLAFDNMQDRPISGSAAPAPFSVTLDVPAAAQSISFGILVAGSGKVDFTALALH